MWGLFNSKPTCPIDAEQQRWIDARFQWLQQQFGEDVPREARVVLPTPEFFPDPYDGTTESAQPMLDRVAEYMGADPQRFELRFYSESQPDMMRGQGHWTVRGSAGCYLRPADPTGDAPALIGIEMRQMADPLSLAATLAHEVAHDLLLGQQRIADDESDGEPLTDLLTVFTGMGVFTANATVRDRGWTDGVWVGWSTSRHGYLDQRMLGYALARFALARGEQQPQWMRHVRPDVRVTMKKTLRYLTAS